MKNSTIIKGIAYLHIFSALGIVLFWIGFYSGMIFPAEAFSLQIKNFAGYYAWETSFTVPDFILAASMATGGVIVLKDPGGSLGKLLLIAASGGCIFLGVLDFVYDFNNGMYYLKHIFSYILLVVGIGMPLLGISSIYFLIKSVNS